MHVVNFYIRTESFPYNHKNNQTEWKLECFKNLQFNRNLIPSFTFVDEKKNQNTKEINANFILFWLFACICMNRELLLSYGVVKIVYFIAFLIKIFVSVKNFLFVIIAVIVVVTDDVLLNITIECGTIPIPKLYRNDVFVGPFSE